MCATRTRLSEHDCEEAGEPKEPESHLEPQGSALRAEQAFEDHQAQRDPLAKGAWGPERAGIWISRESVGRTGQAELREASGTGF